MSNSYAADRQRRECGWRVEGNALAAMPVPGAVVTMHWDWVCDRITAEQSRALDAAEDSGLRIANRMLSTDM